MSSQQSFFPLLSNATLYERMFRSKPYTKCVDCLTNDKLKCKKCMQVIIKDISQNDNQRKNFRIKEVSFNNCLNRKFTQYSREQVRLKKNCSTYDVKNNKQNQQKIMITSKYNLWLAERIKKRHTDMNSSIKSSWPKKTKFKNGSFQNFGVKQPKFQRWQKKLIDQLLLKNQHTQ